MFEVDGKTSAIHCCRRALPTLIVVLWWKNLVVITKCLCSSSFKGQHPFWLKHFASASWWWNIRLRCGSLGISSHCIAWFLRLCWNYPHAFLIKVLGYSKGRAVLFFDLKLRNIFTQPEVHHGLKHQIYQKILMKLYNHFEMKESLSNS